MSQEVLSESWLLLCHRRRGIPPATNTGPRPSSLYGLMAAQPPGVAQRQPRKHGGEGLSGEKVLEKSLIIAGSAQPVSFFSSLADCSHYAMRPWAGPGSCYRDSNPGQRGGHVSSGHPRVHMPWSDEGHAQTHRLTQCGFSINKARSWRDRWGQASGLTVLHPPGLRLRHLPCSSLVLLTMDHYPGLWVGGRGAGERSRRPAWGAGWCQNCPRRDGAAATLCLASPSPGNQQINSPNSQHTCAKSVHPARQQRTTEGGDHVKLCCMLVTVDGL